MVPGWSVIRKGLYRMKLRKFLSMLSLSLVAVLSSVVCRNVTAPSVQPKRSLSAIEQESLPSTEDKAIEITDEDADFTAEVKQAGKTSRSQSLQIYFKSDSGESYMFGYNGDREKDEYYPLIAQYRLTDNTTKKTRVVNERIECTSTTNVYDGFGPNIGKTDLRFNFDFIFSENETFDMKSLKLFNIFSCENAGALNKEKAYKISSFKFPSNVKNIEFDDYVMADLKNVGTFGGYASFNVVLDNNTEELYKTNKKSYYENNKKDLDAGKAEIVAEFSNVLNSYFYLEYEDGTVLKRAVKDDSITSKQTLAKGSNRFTYLLKDVDLDGLKSFSLCNLSFTMSVYNVLTDGIKKIKPNTALSSRIGCLSFKVEQGSIQKMGNLNIVLFVVLASVIYLVLVAGGIYGLYMYQKKKYRNDEFRRVDPRRFFKTAGIAYFGGLDLLLAILFVVFRGGIFNNSLTTFNPLDNFIVVTWILLIFFVGYFVKYFITFIKDRKARKEAEKLNLDDSIDNDGTK